MTIVELRAEIAAAETRLNQLRVEMKIVTQDEATQWAVIGTGLRELSRGLLFSGAFDECLDFIYDKGFVCGGIIDRNLVQRKTQQVFRPILCISGHVDAYLEVMP